MIVSFSVSNYRSFSAEQTLSLVASNRFSGSHEDHLVAIPHSDETLLKTAVIYGANGAGKSNLFKALKYVRSMALEPRRKSGSTNRQPFRLGHQEQEPSTFDLQFISNDTLYRFGFSVDDQYVKEEWLLKINGSREDVIYERVTDSDGKVEISTDGLSSQGKKIKALATIGGPHNQCFLATIFATLEPEDFGKDINSVFSWLNNQLFLISPNSSFNSLGHKLSSQSNFREFAGEFLKNSSTGIEFLDVTKRAISEEELLSIIPPELFKEAKEDLRKADEGVVVFSTKEGNDIVIEKAEPENYFRISVRASHRTSNKTPVSFDIREESDGTRRLLHLMPALHHLMTEPAVYFIDEIDRSLHPILVWNFINFFLNSCSEGKRQIIVTTHESNLLDQSLLRRDEIWFAEKDNDNSSKLYSLADFNIRKDLEIRKHYLQGRFGAIPFLGDLDKLSEKISNNDND